MQAQYNDTIRPVYDTIRYYIRYNTAQRLPLARDITLDPHDLPRAFVLLTNLAQVLFNDTIRYNIRYGRPAASDAEVEEAAQAACIHETIVTKFPNVGAWGS